jgi:acyl-CoA reductase-like NAD-dependent aldehyde dehydrogenase
LLSPEVRIEFIESFSNKLINYKKEIVQVMIEEIAKPQKSAISEFDRTVGMIELIVEEYKKSYSIN